jgi:hypothetical protein
MLFVIEAWTNDVSKRIMLASTTALLTDILLPAGNGKNSLVNIIVEIRDLLNCVQQCNLIPVVVVPDTEKVNTLINDFERISGTENHINLIMESFASGNQDAVGQVLTSVSQVINDRNIRAVEEAVASKNI